MSEVAQSCPTLCDSMDCRPSGSSVHGILQARILEWVAISFSRGSSRPSDRTQVSHIAGRHFNLWATREAQNIYFHVFIYLAAPSLSCCMWDLVPWPRIEPGPLALRAWSLSLWTTREVSWLVVGREKRMKVFFRCNRQYFVTDWIQQVKEERNQKMIQCSP